jgi:hypothetical protein
LVGAITASWNRNVALILRKNATTTLRHRPRPVGSARLAQETEELRSRLIKKHLIAQTPLGKVGVGAIDLRHCALHAEDAAAPSRSLVDGIWAEIHGDYETALRILGPLADEG